MLVYMFMVLDSAVTIPGLRCWVGRCPHEDMDRVFLVHLQLPVKLHPGMYTPCLVTQYVTELKPHFTLFYRYQCPRPTLCARPDRIPTATKSQCQWSHLALRHITDRTQSTAYIMRLSVKMCLVMLVINVLISQA